MKAGWAIFAASLLFLSGPAAAHDPSLHAAPIPSATPARLATTTPGSLPFEHIGGPFTLTDHHGQQRTDADFHGAFLLVFFGYANCKSICPVVLQRMTAALDALGAGSSRVQPVLITVDPENGYPLLLGLTGTAAQVQKTMQAFQVESTQVSQAGDGSPVYAHGSFIYLMRPDGKFATLIPPVLGVDQMADILRRYVN